MKQSLKMILASSTEEKIEAVEAIWDSIDNDTLAVTDEEVQTADSVTKSIFKILVTLSTGTKPGKNWYQTISSLRN